MTGGLSLTGQILGVFALIGLGLAAVGIYGVIANLVAQRTSEIGIRMALGAQAHDVLWLVLGQGVRLACIGTAIGLVCSWGLVRLLIAIIPAIPGGDPASVAAVAALLVAVALFACWLPARRATRVDPIIALPGQDPLLVGGMALLLLAATLLACWLPARRATRIDPIVALRDE